MGHYHHPAVSCRGLGRPSVVALQRLVGNQEPRELPTTGTVGVARISVILLSHVPNRAIVSYTSNSPQDDVGSFLGRYSRLILYSFSWLPCFGRRSLEPQGAVPQPTRKEYGILSGDSETPGFSQALSTQFSTLAVKLGVW